MNMIPIVPPMNLSMYLSVLGAGRAAVPRLVIRRAR